MVWYGTKVLGAHTLRRGCGNPRAARRSAEGRLEAGALRRHYALSGKCKLTAGEPASLIDRIHFLYPRTWVRNRGTVWIAKYFEEILGDRNLENDL